MATGITEKLAAHTAKIQYEDIPPEAIEKAKDCILDQLGVELIGLTNGKTYKTFEAYPPGSPLNIVSREVLRSKFRKMARAVLAEERVEKLIEAVERLETYDDAAKLVPPLVK